MHGGNQESMVEEAIETTQAREKHECLFENKFRWIGQMDNQASLSSQQKWWVINKGSAQQVYDYKHRMSKISNAKCEAQMNNILMWKKKKMACVHKDLVICKSKSVAGHTKLK